MNEDLLQYVWRMGLFSQSDLQTISGETIQIIKRGHLNTDSGPDFSQSRIRIGEADWVGHVEIHNKASEWYTHGHHLDPAYNNTVLHVVRIYDKPVERLDGSIVPTLEIGDRLFPEVVANFSKLTLSMGWIPCENHLPDIDHFTKTMMMERAVVGRLEKKSEDIIEVFKMCNFDWQSAFYNMLSRNFGFSVNAAAFEMLAKALPLRVIDRHRENLHELEALLFGTAGFLEKDSEDDYSKKLQDEYHYLKKKFTLQQMDVHLWKHMRMRPANFPEIRLAQLASLVHRSSHLFSIVLETKDVKELKKLFSTDVSDYWFEHYRFGAPAKSKHGGNLSEHSAELLLINTVVPFLFSYGKHTGSDHYRQRALELLQVLKAEENNIIDKWKGLKVTPANAYDTQALLHHKKFSCDLKLCLNCPVGNKILQRKIEE
ncbi:MAG: DUF2851 family protein [Bacteroidia bacterium]|nr:DUF2851 family protein [Bacteroidia bacterium]